MQREKTIWLWLVLCAAQPAWGAEPAEPTKPAAVTSQEQLEKQFAEELSGATLVGHYTMGNGGSSPKQERYELGKVTKLDDNLWRFDTRIVYGEHDVKLPLTLRVAWAGDTPVITLTDLGVPGLGTYSARVVIYRGQYAGVWSGGDHGGQLFGRVEKPGSAPADSKSTDAKSK